MIVSYLNFVFFIDVKAKSKYRILNFVFQFIKKKTKWHFWYTDSAASEFQRKLPKESIQVFSQLNSC